MGNPIYIRKMLEDLINETQDEQWRDDDTFGGHKQEPAYATTFRQWLKLEGPGKRMRQEAALRIQKQWRRYQALKRVSTIKRPYLAKETLWDMKCYGYYGYVRYSCASCGKLYTVPEDPRWTAPGALRCACGTAIPLKCIPQGKRGRKEPIAAGPARYQGPAIH